MIHILVNDVNFDSEWAYASLLPYIKKDSQVTVIAFVNHEGWSEEEEWEYQFSKGGKKYEQIISAFNHYQIKPSHINWIDPYKDSKEIISHSLLESDIVYLYASDSSSMMRCLEDRGLVSLFVRYQGTYLCNYAASYCLMKEFDSMYEWEEEKVNGLGLLDGFMLVSDYIEDAQHLEKIIRYIEMKGDTAIAFGKDGGVVIDNGTVDLLGNAFSVSDMDLDALYRAYEDAKSRLEYYGDNGLW